MIAFAFLFLSDFLDDFTAFFLPSEASFILPSMKSSCSFTNSLARSLALFLPYNALSTTEDVSNCADA